MKSNSKLFFGVFIALFIGIIASQRALAQSSSVKAVGKSVFSLTTFKADGSLLHTTRGFFLDSNGSAISAWKPFVGADSAVVIDANGQALPVEFIKAANEIYDICLFKVNGKTTQPKLSGTASKPNNKVWAVGYSIKKPDILPMTIGNVETFMEKFAYYILPATMPDNADNCPIANDKGEIIGILQQSTTSNKVHAVDVNFASSLPSTTGLSITDPVLSQCNIAIEMPQTEQQALIMMIMAGEKGTKNYPQYVKTFKTLFPKAIDGYTAQANLYINNNQLALAAQEMEQAIKQVSDKDIAYSEYAKLVYQQQILHNDSSFTAWSLDKALDLATKANEVKPNPAYQHQQAQIIFAQGNYQKAYEIFMGLTQTTLHSSELFYEAAQAKTQLQAPKNEIIALLDSAVAAAPRPLTTIAAPYILTRGMVLDEVGDYKKAIDDYNLYDSLLVGRADAQFYYTRYKCLVQLKRYQQALNDIAHASILDRQQPTYLAELASLQLRVNMFEGAIQAADLCLSAAPNYADAYLIKGLALIQCKRKTEGLEALKKAKELGDARAQGFIDKYQ